MRIIWVICSLCLCACTATNNSSNYDHEPLGTNAYNWQPSLLVYVHDYLLIGEIGRAGAILQKVTTEQKAEMLTSNLDYVLLYGVYLLQSHQLDRAITHYELAREFFPENANLMNNYGIAWQMKGDFSKACHWFSMAVEKSYAQLQSALINLSRCELVNKNANNSQKYINLAKEIADLPYIGLLTELNLVLIQGDSKKAQRVYRSLQSQVNRALYTEHKTEYECLARQLKQTENDTTVNTVSWPLLCVGISRY